MTTKPVPTPGQIHTWLIAHGWTPENPLPTDPEDGVDYVYKERADDGREITVRVPQMVGVWPYYPLDVRAVVVTAAGMEDRPEADVLAEMLATEVTSTLRAPAAPVV